MKLSIVTVCKNSSDSIINTIESVLTQKSVNVEYVVVDGGSTDGTVDIVQSFGDDIDKFVSEADDGISDAFNKGISLATGDIVGLINSDDTLLPGSVEKIQAIFKNHLDIDVLHGDIQLFKGEKFVKRVKPAGRWWYPWRLVLFNHPATFVRKTVYKRFGGFSFDYRIAMDIDIFLRWTKKGVKIHYLEESLVAMHYGGLSDRNAFEGYRESRKAFLANGYPHVAVNILFICKLVLHCIGRVHACLLLWCRNKKQSMTQS